ncbi:hypothetical protein Sgou_23620 [Streptomyces gougerotii]|uniref:Uncharacterized protein n=3 Tax=Streptomyces TaxID=1883 RepID=A0A8H9HMC1_9ACTN|nr:MULTISPECIES: DUF5819 family protein [Streptomyces]SUP58170.1 Uncharacterised protein [Streptomyces griseus]GFH70280.1 hypothetical protein Sdia_10480 [Streptomyces diastaticus subsp. diastaticus]GFH77692.1 hypothetical protein Sgou_23620 [Streptomyces gougerotii]GGU16356.1 hypothetical protein GCM10015534_18930 [Streptomyces diastaticus subsp. diastaticus]GGU72708.1 hypothetical protein GCM10010227_28880 [Streptomyces gougerotii]
MDAYGGVGDAEATPEADGDGQDADRTPAPRPGIRAQRTASPGEVCGTAPSTDRVPAPSSEGGERGDGAGPAPGGPPAEAAEGRREDGGVPAGAPGRTVYALGTAPGLSVPPQTPAAASSKPAGEAGADSLFRAAARTRAAAGAGARGPGIAGLRLGYQVVAAVVLALVAAGAGVHLLMVFLHVAPANTVTKQHGRAVDDYVYPEFEQNWKLFAPNPLQQNIAVQARAEVLTEDGTLDRTRWVDLSVLDGEAIDGNLLPSHTRQNLLRRGWDFYVNSHDGDGVPDGLRGELSERYVRRIVLTRLVTELDGTRDGVVDRIQVRSRTTQVPSPPWSDEKVSREPVDRELGWWSVTDADVPLGGTLQLRRAGNGRGADAAGGAR